MFTVNCCKFEVVLFLQIKGTILLHVLQSLYKQSKILTNLQQKYVELNMNAIYAQLNVAYKVKLKNRQWENQ